MLTTSEANRVHQARPTPTGSRHIGMPVNRSWCGSSHLGSDTLSTPVQQRQRARHYPTSSVDVLDSRYNNFGLLGDGLHVSQTVVEIVRDTVEQETDDEEKDRQNSDQHRDADYRQKDKSHV
jgi:hypothetical protein